MENIVEEHNLQTAVTDLLETQLYSQKPKEDKVWIWGLAFLGISVAIFSLTDFFNLEGDSFFGLFVLHYALAIIYFILITVNRKYLKRNGIYRKTFAHTTLLLILYLVSAYALNRALPIFQDSVTWLSVSLFLCAAPYVFYRVFPHLPPAAKIVFHLLLGASLVLWVYLALYLIPIYYFGAILAVALGISAHSFVPLLLLGFGIRVAVKSCRSVIDKSAMAAGIILPLVIAGVFIGQWQRTDSLVTEVIQKAETEDQNYLPNWARISQQLPKNWITEKYIKSNLVYVGNFGAPWDFDRVQFDEVKKHDPLVTLAGNIIGQPNLSDEDKVKILETTYDARHQAQEKLWSGENLQTSSIVTRARIYPDYRLAYTEKVIRIKNASTSRWRDQQEALYTFHLPEGAVVTSLSLWIENQEQKGYLTTKSKADSAYRTIVGVESRDPSVIHWQEGNTVVVRVFPCLPQEERQFKIGVTAPLRTDGSNLVYENIYFDGPNPNNAQEKVYLQFNREPGNLNGTYNLNQNTNGSYVYNGSYKPDWHLTFAAPKLAVTGFTFDGQYYAVSETKPAFESFTPEAIYLDVNNAWTKEDWQDILAAARFKNVFVYQDGFIPVTPKNQEELYNQLHDLQFTLFPVYHIEEPDHALIVTKSAISGPNLQDLKKTAFSRYLKSYLDDQPHIRVYNLGSEKSAYIKTLKELRVFEYDEGSTDKLSKLLKEGKFSQSLENDTSVELDGANVSITATPAPLKNTASTAPDHLLRLFAYNDIMKKVSRHYFKADAATDELIAEAQKANIVSPVSSLVVLETQKDYERFGITQSKNSLGNASAKAAGSVPEPHEWALILLVAAFGGYLLLKPYIKARFSCF